MSKSPQRETFLAPAKINLSLHVLGRRSDGYHEVAMLLQRISLFDRVTLTLEEKPGLRVVCNGLDLPAGEENIAARAARELFAAAGVKSGLEIAIDKHIPVAAGLGGGSSDAASVLVGLNRMLALNIDRQVLMDIGLRLGADVPFFIFGGPAWATGIGEHLERVPDLPSAWYVLVNPQIPVSTAWVYQNLGLTSPRLEARLPEFPKTVTGLVEQLHNDLERVTIPRYPIISEIKRLLLFFGAAGTLMSGSGSTVFGVFEQAETARQAWRELSKRTTWRSFLTAPV